MVSITDLPLEMIMKGFTVHRNRFTGYWFCLSNYSNENGDYQFCFKELEDQAIELCGLLNCLIHVISELKSSRDKWRQLSKEFMHYSNCYERAIEQVVDEGFDQATIDRINELYDEYEKDLEDVVE